jgi:hypothetical protein
MLFFFLLNECVSIRLTIKHSLRKKKEMDRTDSRDKERVDGCEEELQLQADVLKDALPTVETTLSFRRLNKEIFLVIFNFLIKRK